METMQITLVQALAPEPKVPEAERSDEFSSILSGKEVVSQAESPPGQSPPPAEKQAVEGAEIQEPNAQSQKPDFHCKNEASASEKTDDTDVEAGDDAKTGDGSEANPADANTASTPQLLAQAALSWVASIPPTVAEAQMPSTAVGQLVETDPIAVQAPIAAEVAQIEPNSLLVDAAPTKVTGIEIPSALVDPSNIQAPVDQRTGVETKKATSPEANAVPIADLPVEDGVKTEIIASVPSNEPVEKALAEQSPVKNAKVQAAISPDSQVVEATVVPETAKSSLASSTPVHAEVASAEAAPKTVDTPATAEVKPEIVEKAAVQTKAAADAPTKTEVEAVQTQPATAQVAATLVEADKPSKANAEAVKAAPEASKTLAEKQAPAQKAATDDDLTDKKTVVDKTQPVQKAEAAMNAETAFKGQDQNSEGKDAQTGTAKTEAAPISADKTQSHGQTFKIATEAAPAAKEQAPLTSAKTTEVIRQIVDRVESIAARHQNGVVIRLDPQDLGTITMTVRSIGDQVEAHIVASDDRVRTALDTTRSQLAQAIESKGFNLKSVTVNETSSTQTQADLANQNRSQSQQQTKQDQQALRQQSNMWSYAYGNKESATPQGGFRRTAQTGLDLWT